MNGDYCAEVDQKKHCYKNHGEGVIDLLNLGEDIDMMATTKDGDLIDLGTSKQQLNETMEEIIAFLTITATEALELMLYPVEGHEFIQNFVTASTTALPNFFVPEGLSKAHSFSA